MCFTRSTSVLEVERVLGHEHDVRPAVRGAEGDVAGVAAHDLDDGDAAVALRRRADALDAAGGDEDGRGVAGRDVVDDAGRGRRSRATRVRL